MPRCTIAGSAGSWASVWITVFSIPSMICIQVRPASRVRHKAYQSDMIQCCGSRGSMAMLLMARPKCDQPPSSGVRRNDHSGLLRWVIGTRVHWSSPAARR
jgi:hypothetical protein